jgi:hypothetical protein
VGPPPTHPNRSSKPKSTQANRLYVVRAQSIGRPSLTSGGQQDTSASSPEAHHAEGGAITGRGRLLGASMKAVALAARPAGGGNKSRTMSARWGTMTRSVLARRRPRPRPSGGRHGIRRAWLADKAAVRNGYGRQRFVRRPTGTPSSEPPSLGGTPWPLRCPAEPARPAPHRPPKECGSAIAMRIATFAAPPRVELIGPAGVEGSEWICDEC